MADYKEVCEAPEPTARDLAENLAWGRAELRKSEHEAKLLSDSIDRTKQTVRNLESKLGGMLTEDMQAEITAGFAQRAWPIKQGAMVVVATFVGGDWFYSVTPVEGGKHG